MGVDISLNINDYNGRLNVITFLYYDHERELYIFDNVDIITIFRPKLSIFDSNILKAKTKYILH
jgi:hypothetical protein